MIDTCCEEAVYLDMTFNAQKSNSIRYGPKYTDLNRELHVDSISIPCVNRVKYLGAYLMSAKSLLAWTWIFYTANITSWNNFQHQYKVTGDYVL